MAQEVDRLPPAARRAFANRLDTLVSTLAGESLPLDDALDLVAAEVGHEADLLWLADAVLGAELPSDEDMNDLLVRARLGGTWAALAPQLAKLSQAEGFRDVEVLRGAVTCDVHTTVSQDFLSGIQRVVRETTMRWQENHEVDLVGWTRSRTAFRRIREDERGKLFGTLDPVEQQGVGAKVIVPWEGIHLWVEVITDLNRTGRLLAMAQHSRNRVGVLGYDSIPITSAATVAKNMTSHFARGLAAARQADRVAMISEAAAEEFRGVMDMGAGRRDPGPEVAAVPLAVSSSHATAADLAETRSGLVIEGLPMFLVVGSHEPRKNHLAILHAAELLWREGLQFNLVFVGAGSWNAAEYQTRVGELTGAGRPIQSLRGLPDNLLWAAYRLAHCTLFPSLNEGFGLPVAESLSVGTPVITSNFGSMRDIVAPDGVPLGGLLVDPHDDASLLAAMRTMLTDATTYERLKAETAQHSERTWDEYAEELWSFLVDGVRPSA
jgi:glycosyltransferase involved in cell wall biosynthesis